MRRRNVLFALEALTLHGEVVFVPMWEVLAGVRGDCRFGRHSYVGRRRGGSYQLAHVGTFGV